MGCISSQFGRVQYSTVEYHFRNIGRVFTYENDAFPSPKRAIEAARSPVRAAPYDPAEAPAPA